MHVEFCLSYAVALWCAGSVITVTAAFSLHDRLTRSSPSSSSSAPSPRLTKTNISLSIDASIQPMSVTDEDSSDSPFPSNTYTPWHLKNKPFLAIITETDACDSDQRMEETFETIQNALGKHNENNVDLISIRVVPPPLPPMAAENQNDVHVEYQRRIIELTRRIMSLKRNSLHADANSDDAGTYNECMVVVNDNVEAAIEANADGVHVKEKDTVNIPRIKKLFQKRRESNLGTEEGKGNEAYNNSSSNNNRNNHECNKVLFGTSAHTIESALSNWELYQPDYFFVGTCYVTQSHPEKASDDLEGPRLPGIIKQSICNDVNCNGNDKVDKNESRQQRRHSPIIFAIGGIDFHNCHEPVQSGADGIAVIRSVMQAQDPAKVVCQMKDRMS